MGLDANDVKDITNAWQNSTSMAENAIIEHNGFAWQLFNRGNAHPPQKDQCIKYFQNSGKKLNGCGVCVDENDENFDDYGTDCSGNCTTSIANTYYMDDCGQCLLTTDEKWNNCLNNIQPTNDASSNSGNNDGNGGGSSSDNGVLYIIIAIAAFVLIIIAFGVICWQCKRHNEMKRQFNDIIQNYRPMDDLAVDDTKKSKKKSTRGGTSDYTTSVPAEESD